MRSIIIITFFAFMLVIACNNAETTMSSTQVKGMSGSNVNVYRYQVDSITYLVFDKGSASTGGVFVINYTADSMAYQFLQPQTK